MKEQRVFVVLGGQNDEQGLLSQSSKERLDKCFALYREGDKILCTGGWGENFNSLEEPHAFFAKQYLMDKGLDSSVFLPFALSSHTVDDAVKTRDMLQGQGFSLAVIITSDFHMKRVKYIFNEVLSGFSLKFYAAQSLLEKSALTEVIEHEKEAIKKIEERGLYY